ncbi:hypothetical protein OUZ56_029474 [Daphnia magna]|uniref:Secreted protein n=1 Tax=Daphnia magna TaxID=35525 RepID=A0ABR0B6Z3_9CRUS|nr:hypothetical protein OUZ56_029474 [Daphnia magna]
MDKKKNLFMQYLLNLDSLCLLVMVFFAVKIKDASTSWADACAAAITAACVVRVWVNSSRSLFSSGLSSGTASCGSGAGLE